MDNLNVGKRDKDRGMRDSMLFNDLFHFFKSKKIVGNLPHDMRNVLFFFWV